jgi:hypothetical protein
MCLLSSRSEKKGRQGFDLVGGVQDRLIISDARKEKIGHTTIYITIWISLY